jgi:hypothetical protein
MQLAHELGIDPALMHRVAVIGAGTLAASRTTCRGDAARRVRLDARQELLRHRDGRHRRRGIIALVAVIALRGNGSSESYLNVQVS